MESTHSKKPKDGTFGLEYLIQLLWKWLYTFEKKFFLQILIICKTTHKL
jgi:hypothetical protein